MSGFTVKVKLRSRISQRVSGGLTTCWRRGRRGSELARGERKKQIHNVRAASCEKLQERLARLPSNQRDLVVQDFEFMKFAWCEQAFAKYSFWDHFPHHMQTVVDEKQHLVTRLALTRRIEPSVRRRQ